MYVCILQSSHALSARLILLTHNNENLQGSTFRRVWLYDEHSHVS